MHLKQNFFYTEGETYTEILQLTAQIAVQYLYAVNVLQW